MPRPLTKTDVVERLHVLPLESYALIANVAKGIALGVGSLVLLQILAKINMEWMRLLPWSASMVAVLLSYVKWTRGTILSNAHANVWDSFIPLLMGVAEFVLFAILVVENEPTPSFLWLNWPVCLAAHSLIASALVNNRLRLTEVKRDFSDDLADLGKEYVEWLRMDRIQAGLSGLFALLLWIVGRAWVLPTYGTGVWMKVVCAFASLSFVAAWKPISDANSQRKRTDEFVTEKRGAPSTAALVPLNETQQAEERESSRTRVSA